MMGIHPCDIKESYKSDLEWIQNHYQKNPNRYFGIGEIGLDYHWDLTFQKEQIWAFEAQLEWAIAENKAVSIHSRKANQDAIPIVTKHAKKGLKGVMHCFSGSIQEAEKIIDAGFFLGIGGVVTYPKAGLAEILPQIPLSKIVLETDAPFLPPVPHRGKQNESGYLFHVAEKLAEIYNIPYDEVAQITSQNAIQLFNLQSLMA
jgi:TatD DNase family protein